MIWIGLGEASDTEKICKYKSFKSGMVIDQAIADSVVALSNGEKAKVVENDPQYPLQPRVVGLKTGTVYDLSNDIKCASLIIES